MNGIKSALMRAEESASRTSGKASIPLHHILSRHSELFDIVLSFCLFEDILATQVAGAEMKDGLLNGICKRELHRLGDELIGACMENRPEQVESLLSERNVPAGLVVGNAWRGFRSPLSTAAMRGHHEIVRRLLLTGADVNWADENGTTALELATVRRNNQHSGELQPLGPGSDLDETIKILRTNGGQILYQADGDY